MTRRVMILLGVLALSGCVKQPPPVESAASSEDFLSDAQRAELHLPASAELTLPAAADGARADHIDPQVSEAVDAFLKPQAVQWRLVAARPVGDHILLWIAFPKIVDGGTHLIYSVEKKRIVGKFLGGYLG